MVTAAPVVDRRAVDLRRHGLPHRRRPVDRGVPPSRHAGPRGAPLSQHRRRPTCSQRCPRSRPCTSTGCPRRLRSRCGRTGTACGGRWRMALRSSSRVAWTRGTRSSKPRIGARSGGPLEVTHLVNVHGVDIDVGDWEGRCRPGDGRQHQTGGREPRPHPGDRGDQPPSLLQLGRPLLALGPGRALSAIALLLQDDFRRFVTAAGAITSAVATNPQREAGGRHPAHADVLDLPVRARRRRGRGRPAPEALPGRPLTARHGDAPGVLGHPRARLQLRPVRKRSRTTLELAAGGALGACPTLPGELDPVAIAGITALFPHEGPILEDRYRRLEAQGAHREVLDALQEGITRIRRAAEQRERGLDTIRATIPPDGPFGVARRGRHPLRSRPTSRSMRSRSATGSSTVCPSMTERRSTSSGGPGRRAWRPS